MRLVTTYRQRMSSWYPVNTGYRIWVTIVNQIFYSNPSRRTHGHDTDTGYISRRALFYTGQMYKTIVYRSVYER